MTSISATQTGLHQYRQQFPALANKAYFNFGGQGPMPQTAMNAVIQAQDQIQQIGPFGSEVNAWLIQQTKATRVAIATELNVPSETITLTEDVTVGCNIAMWGIDWKAGDHILLTDCEHPGIVATAREIARRFSLEVTTCPIMATLNNGDPVAIIAEYLRPRTRMVVLSHVLWNTGQVLPLEKIVVCCRNNNTKLMVDAAQSVGLLSLNLGELGVDFYAFTGHKWLCGPPGVGGLYVRPQERESLYPTFVGWRSVVIDGQAQPVKWQESGERYEIATSAYPFYIALTEAISVHQKWGTSEQRYQQICRNSEYLWNKLMAVSGIKCLLHSPPESGLVSFQLESNQSKTSLELVKFLEAKAIFTRTIADPDCVRACVHYFTLESEIDQLVEEIQGFCK
ncbi:aminotransferase class V-fold PLP-dependent enzyme [Plectonema cf. radiosum LEGE 06105]|uniref:Aminotransferase class V-fold PLP-dependent enzyme n=1 Tax=Plectonema cf. radiosum LEGE 06105 TaxID=945769 RepID=A0A8J7FE31_9CYAN|nr:aminotransferase class V-fold PLP-dependent enzyme [Plectonema radiosum]MBE9216964.1 aminotransferase class V-fold PLP-dependent enzyme [Plectonema cf. radiosum LEGE 06105]